MSLFDFIKKAKSESPSNRFHWKDEPDGLALTLPHAVVDQYLDIARHDPFFGIQLAFLKQLYEQGLAEQFSNGWVLNEAAYWKAEPELVDMFELPAVFPGSISLDIESTTGRSNFKATAILIIDNQKVFQYTVRGPLLRITAKECYRLTHQQWLALSAIRDHNLLPAEAKTEFTNNLLLYQLQQAKHEGLAINLAHFNDFELIKPEAVGLVINQQPNGDVILLPNYGVKIDTNDFVSRVMQLQGDGAKIFRVGKKLILLDEERLKATHEILTNYKVPKEQVKRFFDMPTAYLDATLVNLDEGFSLRVNGAAPLVHGYFGDTEKSGIEWFSSLLESQETAELREVIEGQQNIQEVEEIIEVAIQQGADVAIIDDKAINLSDPPSILSELETIKKEIEQGVYTQGRKNTETKEKPEDDQVTAVVDIKPNDEDADFRCDIEQVDDEVINQVQFATDNLKRLPYEHQKAGIQWLLGHALLGLKSGKSSGALLADDMGLGKTYMVLVAIQEYFNRLKQQDSIVKPVLIVAPLSLLENWQAEIDKTFHVSPFSDVVILQSGADMKRFRKKGVRGETRQSVSEEGIAEIRYGLNIGKEYGIDRLDMPGRLVLTTYQALRDFQFSLCSVDWGIVAFDEAQNIKNPNALQTRAAKGLKADFRLLATGTPVENTLKDIWCLFDMALPGSLGSWQEFHKRYITPINQAAKTSAEAEYDAKVRIGEELRQRIGNFMLRRLKEENLKGLPQKSIWSGVNESGVGQFDRRLQSTMQGRQLQAYNQVVKKVQKAPEGQRQQVVLPSLAALREISIHHDLQSLIHQQQEKTLFSLAMESCKLQSVINILDDIRQREEKAIIFITSKALQLAMSVLLQSKYNIEIDIINGDTLAISSKKDELTRKGIIDKFEAKPGFGIIIMSPVATGVGLTVTGANNVIHLERHWNPAKEAQATDRVYRIGQKKPVHVYIPVASHPDITSFDISLNRMMSKKVDLSQSIMAINGIRLEEMSGIFG